MNPTFERTANGIRVSVYDRNNGFAVYVNGWRVAYLKTEAGALRRAHRELDAASGDVRAIR